MKKIRMIKENDVLGLKCGEAFEVDEGGYIEILGVGNYPVYLLGDIFIDLGYAEYIDDREGIGDMGEGYSVECTLPYSTKILNAPFSIDAVAFFIDATLRLMKIVSDCNEGKEWGRDGLGEDSQGFSIGNSYSGEWSVWVTLKGDSANFNWDVFKSEEDAEWSMKEHKDLWGVYFKGLWMNDDREIN